MFCSRFISLAIKCLSLLFLSFNFNPAFAQSDNQNPYQTPLTEVEDIASTQVIDLLHRLESLNEKVKSGEIDSNEQIVSASFEFLRKYYQLIPQFVKKFPDEILQMDYRVMTPILFYLLSEDIQEFYNYTVSINSDSKMIHLINFARVRQNASEEIYYKSLVQENLYVIVLHLSLLVGGGFTYFYSGDNYLPMLAGAVISAIALPSLIKTSKDLFSNLERKKAQKQKLEESKELARNFGMSEIALSTAEKTKDIDACQSSFLSLYLSDKK